MSQQTSSKQTSSQQLSLSQIVTQGRKAQRPVDDIPPLKRLLPLAVQHVLALYAGAVAVPLIVGARWWASANFSSPTSST